MIVLVVALTVFWVIVCVTAALHATHGGPYWALLAVGSVFFLLVLVGVALYLALSIKSINLSRRQSNFIDSVTHELKSPIAALKLCVQTLSRHQLSPAQQTDFHRYMLEDLQRLDKLIDHLLDAARLDQNPTESGIEDVNLADVLSRCIRLVSDRYRLRPEAVTTRLKPAMIRARPLDLEVVFGNLLDNAAKYAGPAAQIGVEMSSAGDDRLRVQISDNGPGIPDKLRRKIFGRFVRLGSELERSKPGTGLGLYIVRTLVKRMHGQVTVASRAPLPGTVFEVTLPIASVATPLEPSRSANAKPPAGAPAALPRAAVRQSSQQAGSELS